MTGLGRVLDCVGHPTGAAVRAAGYRGVALYVGIPSRRKAPTRALVDDYLAHGLDLVLVYEDTAGTWRQGLHRGAEDATAVRSHLADLGIDWAAVGCVFMALDTDVVATELEVARAYIAGAEQVLGQARTGAYGGHLVISDLLDRGLISHAWSAAGWQYGHMDSRSVLHQNVKQVNIGGVPCDVNDVLAADFGQYPRHAGRSPGSTPSPSVAPAAAPPRSRGSEDAVALLTFDPTPAPQDSGGRRWQDIAPSAWPASGEDGAPLVPAIPNGGGWRGLGSISSISCGWAGGQDSPPPNGDVKPSGFVFYLRVFHFADGRYRPQDWQVTELVTNEPLVGNCSLTARALPGWCTNLVIRYVAPGGLHLGIEYER